MRFTLTAELGNSAIATGADLAELLVRIAPTVEHRVGTHLKYCGGTVRDLNGEKVGNWMLVEPKPASPATDSKHLSVRDINAHLSDGSRACYVNIGNEQIRIRHARNVGGQLQGKSVNRPGEWIPIPPDAKVELVD